MVIQAGGLIGTITSKKEEPNNYVEIDRDEMEHVNKTFSNILYPNAIVNFNYFIL